MDNTTQNILSPYAAAAALLLGEMERSCAPAILARLMGVPEFEVSAALEELEIQGLSNRDETGKAKAAGNALPPDVLLPLCGRNVPPDSIVMALVLCHRRNYEHFFSLSLSSLQHFAEQNYALTARIAYDIITKICIKIKLDLSDKSLCAKFIHYGMGIQSEMRHFPWNVTRNALSLYYKIRGIAFYLGDRRSLAVIDLAIGHISINLRSPKKSTFYHQVMQRGATAISDLGDSDILLRSASMLCYYYLVEGKYTKAINCAYPLLYLPDSIEHKYRDRSLYCHAAMAATHLGEFDVAANILSLALERALRLGRKGDARSLQGFLAHVYICQGKSEEALELIDEIMGTHHLTVLTYAELWASRSLAYYHYLNGNVLASYNCFKNWLQTTHAQGITHANYIAGPFVLELLAAYYLAGFPPPLHNTMHEELVSAIASPSCLIRGIALRLAGVIRAHEWGWHDSLALDYLQKSLDLFRTFSAPLAMAGTLLALARLHHIKEEEEQATVFAVEAWGIHQRYGHPAWPEDLRGLIDNRHKCDTLSVGLPPSAFCTKLFQAIKEQYAWESDDAFFSSLLYALLAAFGAARGGIFRISAQGPAPLALANLPENVLNMPHFRLAHQLMGNKDDSKWPVYRRITAPTQKIQSEHKKLFSDDAPPSGGQHGQRELFLPVDVEKQGLYLVYLAGTLPLPVTQILGKELFAMLSAYLATEINIYLRRSEAWQAQMRSLPAHSPRLAEANPLLFRTGHMRELMRQVEHLAPKDATVLILGESGVGKELIARRLHELSGAHGEFIGINLASTPTELFESEFYGHEKGSFTGAHYQKRGLFELADKGTLFIDEVGDIPPLLQVKLLRVLQERRFMRVGGTRVLSSEFRLVTATNRDLEQEVRKGRFREDLYYRLNVVPLHIPPLRERPEDILYLANHFLQHFAQRHQSPLHPFTEEEQNALLAYSWPGNVRELKNCVERCVLIPDKERRMFLSNGLTRALGIEHGGGFHTEIGAPPRGGMRRCAKLERGFHAPGVPLPIFPGVHPGFPDSLPSLEEMQNRYFEYVYQRANGAIGGTEGVAAVLGLSRTTAYAWIDKLGLKDKYAKQLVVKLTPPDFSM